MTALNTHVAIDYVCELRSMLTDIVSDVVVSLRLDTAYIYFSLLILILQLLFAANTDCIYVGTVMFLDVVCFVVDHAAVADAVDSLPYWCY